MVKNVKKCAPNKVQGFTSLDKVIKTFKFECTHPSVSESDEIRGSTRAVLEQGFPTIFGSCLT